MKQIVKSILWTGVALSLALSSCSRKEELSPLEKETVDVVPGKENPTVPPFRMEVNAGDPATKTVIDEVSDKQYNILWQAGDALGVYEVANGAVQEKALSDPLTAPGNTATFGLSLQGAAEAPYDYTFVYPASALGKDGDTYLVSLPASQTFAANSFDTRADVLVSEHLHFDVTRPSTLSARFARLGGTARMLIKAPDTGHRIERITFSADEAWLGGAFTLDPATGELSDAITANGSHSLELVPAAATTYSGDVIVWFRVAETTLSQSFTVSVRTESLTYTKTVDLAAAGKSITFQNGKLTKFGVSLLGVDGEENTYERSYAELTVVDVRGQGITTNSYTPLAPFTKEYGDTWSGKVGVNNGGIALRDCHQDDPAKNDSYIHLPRFKDEIASVNVTLSSALSSGKQLILTSEADSETGDIGTLNTVDNQLEYSFDLSELHVTQAYLRVYGAAGYIQKVTVVTKNDDRNILDAPASFTAQLDGNVKNTARLEWETAENASAYLISYTPEGGAAKTVTVPAEEAETMAFILEGLEYNKSYTFSIVSKADPYFNRDSAPFAAAAPVVTGAQPEGIYYDVITLATTGVTGTSYTDWNWTGTATYAGLSAKGNNVIQLNGNSSRGIWTTVSTKYARSVTVTLLAGNTNKVDIYAKNTAYAKGDLYGSSSGTKVGTVTGSATEAVTQKVTLSDNYMFIGIRSYSGVVYVSEIRVEWSDSALPVATVTTDAASDVVATSAHLSGSYTGAADGIYEAGFYWDYTQADLEAMAHPGQVITTDGSNDASGAFSCDLTSLAENTTYYFRAYVLEFDNATQTYVEHFGATKSFKTLSKTAFQPGGWLEIPSYTTGDMAGTTTSDLDDLYQVTHYAQMGGQTARNYTMLYDPAMYASYWVAYPLCKAHLGTGRNEDWGFDPVVPQSKQTSVKKGYGVNVASSTYNNQLYARGHQLPNADRNGVDAMMAQTYFSTNMTPQLQHGFNGGVWNNLEEAVRSVIKNNSDTVYVVTGAAFCKKGGNETIKTITNTRDGKVLPVPNYYWKVLLRVKWSAGSVASASTVAFWLEHRDNYDTGNTNYLPYVTTVDQVEEWTGFDFFTNIGDLQTAAEDSADWSAFKNF